MTRKRAGRWIDGRLTEHADNHGPSRAVVGHGRATLPCLVVAGNRTNSFEMNGRMQMGSKAPGRS